MSGIFTIQTYSSRIDAEMDKSLLESNNIKAIVEGDDCGGMQPNLASVTGGYALIVSENDVKVAKELLRL